MAKKKSVVDQIEAWRKVIEGRKNTYTIKCKTCEEVIGESETDDNGFAMCLKCWHKH